MNISRTLRRTLRLTIILGYLLGLAWLACFIVYRIAVAAGWG